MYNVIYNMIGFTQSTGITQTQQYTVYACCALVILFSILMIDWVRRLFSTLINKLK